MRHMALLMCVAAAIGCERDPTPLGPQDATFIIDLPALRQLADRGSPKQEARAGEYMPVGAHVTIDGVTLPPEFDEISRYPSLIARAEAFASFRSSPRLALAEFIGKTFGNYYRIEVGLTVSVDGRQVGTSSAMKSEMTMFGNFSGSFGDIINTYVLISGDCGHVAQANGKIEAELQWMSASGARYVFGRSALTDNESAEQAKCPVSSSGGGSIGVEEQWYICYWVDYYDANHNFVYRQELGCTPINAE